MDRRSVSARRAVKIRQPRPRFAVLLLAAVSSSSACSSSGPRDAATSDAFEDATALDAFGDASTPDTFGDADVADSAQGTEVPDASQDDQICAQICALGTLIGCSTDSGACASQCLQDLAMRACYPEKIAAQLCVIAIGPDALTCMNGRTFVKAGTCEPEKGALTTCLLGARADAGSD